MARVVLQEVAIGSELKVRDYSEPVQSQKETTAYSTNITSALSYDLDLDVSDIALYENEMIKIWRKMAQNPYVDFAIDDIINEMLSLSEENEMPVKLNISEADFSENIKKKIYDEWEYVTRLLGIKDKGYMLLRDWYIDGKSIYYCLVGEKSIEKIIPLDPLSVKKVITEDKAIYQCPEFGNMTGRVLEIPEKAIVEINSGLMDDRHKIWISYLNKAFVPLNQLTNIEDSVLIYRVSRAPERRVFYIDVGDLPKSKAEAYMMDVVRNSRNKIEYDPSTGKIKESTKHPSILDDVYLPRREGSRGTEVSTLAGACLSMDTEVCLLDGRNLSIRQIEIELSRGKELWTYSCDPVTGYVVPGKITWAGVTKEFEETMDIFFGEKSVTCTLDHKFPILGTGFVEAKDVTPHSQFIPLEMSETSFRDPATLEWVEKENIFQRHVNDKYITSNSVFRMSTNVQVHKKQMEVGSLTVDNEFHTFLLAVGVFTKNSNLGEISDLSYFQNKLFRSLNVPFSRWTDSNQAANVIGRTADISRDEVKYRKCISRLRNTFEYGLRELLKKQVVLKNIVTEEEFDSTTNVIFQWSSSSMFSELLEFDMLQEKMNILEKVLPFQGKIFSEQWILNNIMKMNDQEIKEMQDQISKEKKENPKGFEDQEDEE